MGRIFLVLIVFAALVVALRAARSDPSAAATATAAGRKRRWPWEILAAALLVVAVFGLFWRRWFDT